MKRITGAMLATLAAAMSLSVAAYATHTGDAETISPACADIAGAGLSLTSGVLGGSVSIDHDGLGDPVPSCSSVTYTVYAAYTVPGGKTFVRSESRQGDNTNDFVGPYSIRVPGNLTYVCVYIESTSGGTVLDRAPNTGCVNIGPGAPGGGGTFN